MTDNIIDKDNFKLHIYNNRQIALGLGDLFILRLLCDTWNDEFNYNFEINLHTIKDYRNNNEEYKNFIIYIIRNIFKDKRFYIIQNYEESLTPTKQIYSFHIVYPFDSNYINIKKYFNTDKIIEDKYIIFHTKVRIDYKGMNNEQLDKLDRFIETYKSKYKIVIMGERIISDIYEKNVHKMISIYDRLIKLKNNNEVIDLVEEEIILKPKIEVFERDMRYIANAEMNFGIGWGGNFGMSWAVTDKFCFYIDSLEHKILTFFIDNKNGILKRNYDEFLDIIREY